VTPEATVADGIPQSAGWFVLNAREARWLHNELGGYCGFEGQEDAAFDQLGINLNVLPPGMPMAMYHEEPGQEGFLVLRGECILIVEGEERRLRAWDFAHCPPGTAHTFVCTSDGPCVIVATGNRREDLERIYLRSEIALRYGAGVGADTTDPPSRGSWQVARPHHWDELPWSE
jgi:uncharacterized cupin superfamily protein